MVLSRRALLIGAGGVVAAAAAGVGIVDAVDHPLLERGLHRAGLAGSPDRTFPPSGARLRSGTLTSHYLPGPLGWTVSRPAGAGAVQGIVFCLHGKGSDHRMAFDEIHVPDAAASVGLRVVVAAVDGGTDSYWHRRADGTDAQAMLLQEFVPLVRGLVGPAPQALLGWSMGGYGALLAAEQEPSSFVAVAAASPALWLTPGATAPGAFDGPADFYAHDVFTGVQRLRGLGVAVACGEEDPFYTATRRLVAGMTYPHTAIFGTGFHDDAYWRSVAPAQLRVIRTALDGTT